MLKSRAVTQNVIGSIVIENSFLSDNRMSDPFLDQNVKRRGRERKKKKSKCFTNLHSVCGSTAQQKTKLATLIVAPVLKGRMV